MCEDKTIIAPIELNFLLFVNKIYNKTWYSNINCENFYDHFEDRLELLWNKRVDSLITDRTYVLNDSLIKEDINELINNEKAAETVVKEFTNLWGSLPPHGYGSLIERICGGLRIEQIKQIVGTNTINIMITFDSIPSKYKRENPKYKLKILPYMDFLKYV